jgi:hypothetical protein
MFVRYLVTERRSAGQQHSFLILGIPRTPRNRQYALAISPLKGTVNNWEIISTIQPHKNENKKYDNSTHKTINAKTKNTKDNTYEANIPIHIACCNGTRCDDDWRGA